ncbi:peroxidase TAP [Mycena leptocephala]|nr:peroxidase TAP [Mycena leptocephala]
MKLHTLVTFISLGLGVSATGIHDSRSPHAKRAKTSILFNPPGFPPLPSPREVAHTKSVSTSLNLDDVQGDILIGMRKPTGLFALNLTGDASNLNDPAFAAGQVNDVKNLSDPGATNWVPQFVGTSIYDVILFGSDTEKSINRTLASLQSKLGNTIVEKYSLRGAMRPPPNKGHERELRLPGRDIEPYIDGFTAKPGQAVVPASEILVGQPDDTSVTRPAWARDGSFLVFRQLKQLVPEFNKFLTDNPHIVRTGIPYGPEVTSSEASSNTTQIERGLAFVAYQSNIKNGFQFLQKTWANNQGFRQPGVGFDPIIGVNGSAQRPVNGLDPTDPARNFTLSTGEPISPKCSCQDLAQYHVSRGGEYFFSPSLSAIANTLSV